MLIEISLYLMMWGVSNEYYVEGKKDVAGKAFTAVFSYRRKNKEMAVFGYCCFVFNLFFPRLTVSLVVWIFQLHEQLDAWIYPEGTLGNHFAPTLRKSDSE